MVSRFTNGQLRIAVLSDIHLGHNKTPTRKIVEGLEKAFPWNKVTAQLDMIIIAGDLFDHSLQFSSVDVNIIQQWITRFLTMCSNLDISVRVLEGTPLHDRKQSKNIVSINQSLQTQVDLKYISIVDIEKNEKHGVNILYVPDEWHPDPDKTWYDVQQCLSFNGLDSVDISIMHGMFEYQVPYGCNTLPHNKSRYESITNHYVFIGHIHLATTVDRIVAPGSFDRLKHGDEGSKGHWRAILKDQSNIDELTFIENDNATIYHSIDCREMEYDDILEKISSDISYPLGSHLRLIVSDYSSSLLEYAKTSYPMFHWRVKLTKQEDKIVAEKIYEMDTSAISITGENVSALLSEKLASYGYSDDIKVRALKLLAGKK